MDIHTPTNHPAAATKQQASGSPVLLIVLLLLGVLAVKLVVAAVVFVVVFLGTSYDIERARVKHIHQRELELPSRQAKEVEREFEVEQERRKLDEEAIRNLLGPEQRHLREEERQPLRLQVEEPKKPVEDRRLPK